MFSSSKTQMTFFFEAKVFAHIVDAVKKSHHSFSTHTMCKKKCVLFFCYFFVSRINLGDKNRSTETVFSFGDVNFYVWWKIINLWNYIKLFSSNKILQHHCLLLLIRAQSIHFILSTIFTKILCFCILNYMQFVEAFKSN